MASAVENIMPELRLKENSSLEVNDMFYCSEHRRNQKLINATWDSKRSEIAVTVRFKSQNFTTGEWRERNATGIAEYSIQERSIRISFRHSSGDAYDFQTIYFHRETTEKEKIGTAKHWFILEMVTWAEGFEWRF